MRRGHGRWVVVLLLAWLLTLSARPADQIFAAGGPSRFAPGAGTAGPATPPPGAEQVSFESRNHRLKESVPAVLIRPKGPGPFPAIVLVHPCGGINQTMYNDWAPWFLARGYIVLVPDSLAPWHQTTVCDNWSPLEGPTAAVHHPTVRDAALDAVGALRFLRSRPDVIPTRIALIGWSFGGSVATMVTSARFIKSVARGRFSVFQAGIAVYPGCGLLKNGVADQGIETPLLLLLGGSDDWAKPADCVRVGLARQSAGDRVEVHVIPGATHGFDVTTENETANVSGTIVHLQYNAAATADAHTQAARFLEEHLR